MINAKRGHEGSPPQATARHGAIRKISETLDIRTLHNDAPWLAEPQRSMAARGRCTRGPALPQGSVRVEVAVEQAPAERVSEWLTPRPRRTVCTRAHARSAG